MTVLDEVCVVVLNQIIPCPSMPNVTTLWAKEVTFLECFPDIESCGCWGLRACFQLSPLNQIILGNYPSLSKDDPDGASMPRPTWLSCQTVELLWQVGEMRGCVFEMFFLVSNHALVPGCVLVFNRLRPRVPGDPAVNVWQWVVPSSSFGEHLCSM